MVTDVTRTTWELLDPRPPKRGTRYDRFGGRQPDLELRRAAYWCFLCSRKGRPAEHPLDACPQRGDTPE